REAAGDHRLEVDVLLRLAPLRHFRTEWHAAVDCATKALRVAETAGDLDATASALTALGMYETFLGVGDPARHYRRAIEIEAEVAAQTASSGTFGDIYWAPQTMLSDWQRKNGKLDEARLLLDRQYQRAVEAGDEASRMLLCVHLAELETTAGSFDLAQRWNDEAMALADETQKPLDELARYSERTGLRMFRLLALRCRGLLSAAGGDVEGAANTLKDAAALSAEIPLPFERARTLLALGQVLRRGKQKRLAREALEQARAGFARLGARRWSERAVAELSRIGGRAPMRWELTPTE